MTNIVGMIPIKKSLHRETEFTDITIFQPYIVNIFGKTGWYCIYSESEYKTFMRRIKKLNKHGVVERFGYMQYYF